jgi:hypothetical protein
MRLPARRSSLALTAAGLIALFPAAVRAGETWLAPREPSVALHEFARFDLTTGPVFPRAGRPVPSDRIEHSGVRAGAKELRFSGRSLRKTSLRLAAPIDRACVAAAWLVLKPRIVQRTPGEVREYLARIGSTGMAAAAPPPAPWREVEGVSVKAFVRVGVPESVDRSWADPVGLPLEIVPERDPTLLTAGDVLPLRVFLEGRPIEGIAIVAFSPTGGGRGAVTTDPDGRARIALGEPGAWLLTGTRLERDSARGADWKSDATSLYLVVREPPSTHAPVTAVPSSGPGPATLVPDQPFTGQPPATTKPYEDILRLREAGESNEALLASVRSGRTVYSLTTPEIQKLLAAGVSREVIEEMLRSGRGPTPTPR